MSGYVEFTFCSDLNAYFYQLFLFEKNRHFGAEKSQFNIAGLKTNSKYKILKAFCNYYEVKLQNAFLYCSCGKQMHKWVIIVLSINTWVMRKLI